ncbi:MAG TPA: HD domain-containing protein, partial [Ignavibacteriaceae bacterium]
MPNIELLSKVKEFIGTTFREKGSRDCYYHNFTHTAEVAKVTQEMADSIGVSEYDKEALQIAAWFHDIGHTEGCEGHEDVGINMATQFLKENNYSEDQIRKVVSLINATRMPRDPKNVLEEIICDADLHHLGTSSFEVKAELFKNECEALNKSSISEIDWLKNNLKFLDEHKYFTQYAKDKFETQKNINYIKTEKRLKKLKKKAKEEKLAMENSESIDLKSEKKKSEKNAGRSIET